MPTECGDGQWTKRIAFELKEFQEAAGTHAGFTTSKAETDPPAAYIDDVVNPDTLKSGKITRIRIRLNWVAAETLTAIRFYKAAKGGDYESSSVILYDTLRDFAAGLTKDEIYTIDLDIDFILAEEGKIYYAPEWSGACGNIQGFIVIEGETFG